MSKKTLIRLIKKQTDVARLIKLRDTGLDKMLADSRISNFDEVDKIEVLAEIEKRILELEG